MWIIASLANSKECHPVCDYFGQELFEYLKSRCVFRTHSNFYDEDFLWK